ncbi:FAD-binding protein [Micromonospora sp. BRA006-A]|nr:FAD-binding protein [Micromonospora sp. BRA006-A]
MASRKSAEEIRRRLPSMYHQFKELADVDITREPMEVGPTCHYVMGGVEVDPDSGAAYGTVRGFYAAGEVSGGMHGSNRLGGNSCPTCWSSASARAGTRPRTPISSPPARRCRWRRSRPPWRRRWRPRSGTPARAPTSSSRISRR